MIVNGNPEVAEKPKPQSIRPAPVPAHIPASRRRARANCSERLGPEKFAEWTRSQKRLLITDTTFRDAHQSLMATRVRTYDLLADLEFRRAQTAQPLQPGNVGRGDVRRGHAISCSRIRGRGSNAARGDSEHLLPDVVARVQRLWGIRRIRTTLSRHSFWSRPRQGIDIFRVFDSLNWLPNMKLPIEASRGRRTRFAKRPSATRAILLDPKRDKYPLQYYIRHGERTGKDGCAYSGDQGYGGLVQTVRGGAARSRRCARKWASRSIFTLMTRAA